MSRHLPRHVSQVATAIAAAVFSVAAAHAAALTAGDIAFTTFNADEDGFSFVALANIDAGTVIHFQDNEYVSGAFNTGEGVRSWNSGGSLISAGTVIRFSSYDTASASASIGTLFGGSGDNGINATAETIYAFLGSSSTSPTTFLTALSSGAFTAANGSLTGTGLTAGVNAIAVNSSTDFAQYTGPRSGLATFADYRSLLSNNANWNNLGDGNFENNLPNTTAFTVAPVPLPAAAWLMISGLGGLFGFARRRRAA